MASKTSDGELIALLRGLRAGAGVDGSRFVVHRVDVCSAAPEDLVADQEPAPGTDLTEDGYNSVWYFYCEKRYKNAQGKHSGHRQRAIGGGGGDTCWHAETRPKVVEGSEGGTFCNLSYGRKKQGSGRSFDRLGWCMVEYDDTQHGGGDFVLCKVYRSSSSLAKKKSKISSSSSQKTTTSKKRKAADDHAEARPTKQIHEQMMQQNTGICSQDYWMTFYQGMNPMFGDVQQQQQQQSIEFNQGGEFFGPVPSTVANVEDLTGCTEIFGGEEEQHVQQPSVEPTQVDGEFFQTEYGPLPSAVAQINVEDWMACPETFEEGDKQQSGDPEHGGAFIDMVPETAVEELLGAETRSGESSCVPAAVTTPDAYFFAGLDRIRNWLLGEQGDEQVEQMQQPGAEPRPTEETFEGEEKQQGGEPEQGDGFVDMVPEATGEDLLGPETMSGGESSCVPAAVTPPDADFFAEPCLIEEFTTYLKSHSLWPSSPSTSCQASMPFQQQGSHLMHPIQLSSLMC